MISLQGVSVFFDSCKVLDNFSLIIKNSEFITLLGPSGCGKTTILKIIGGFLIPDKGRVFFQNKDITHTPPYKRNVNTIFQNYALFPHMNVYENVAFGMRVRKKTEREIAIKVKKMLKMVSLEDFETRDLMSLSGGQQQRVTIARALAVDPKVLLLDEPLAALDLKLRKDMQIQLKTIQHETNITFVFVTHDQEEALSMSDRIVVLDRGKIQQIGSPIKVYNEPENAFVADFMGESNILDGVILDDFLVTFAGRKFRCLDKGFKKKEKVDIVIRPEDVKVVKPEDSDLKGVITSVVFKGVHYEMIIDVDSFKWMVQTTKFIEVGSKIGIKLFADDIHTMRKSKYSGEYGDYSTFSDEMYEAYEHNTNLKKS
jgi:spermidine/putrescine transport system ATP-binding protein